MTRVLLDRYELREPIGAGGLARVHRAVDRQLARSVAVKVLDDERARSADPSGRDRFLREARSAARLDHPHLVTVYDAGEDEGDLFLVMELVDGQSLAALIAQRAPLPVGEAISIATQILDGLAAVHAEGIVHRDVKPSNVLVDRDGRVRLTDFGIAKRLDDVEDNLTAAGTVVGTPSYLAPEQASGGRLLPATDVYLVGLVLYEMLTGQRPGGGSLDPRLVRGDVPDHLPDHVADAVLRASDPVPERRFASALAMIEGLRQPEQRQDTLAFPAVVAAAAAAPPTAVMPAMSPTAPAPTATLPRSARPQGAAVGTGMRWWLVPVVVAVVAVLLAVIAFADEPSDAPLVPTTSTPPTSTPIITPTSLPQTPIVTTAPQTPAEDQGGPGGGQGNGKGHKKKNQDAGD